VYNVAGPPANYITLREYGNCIVALFPRSGRLTFGGRAPSLGRVDTTRIEHDLNWVAQVGVREGLARMFADEL